jgi:hypothetical protein
MHTCGVAHHGGNPPQQVQVWAVATRGRQQEGCQPKGCAHVIGLYCWAVQSMGLDTLCSAQP